MKYWNKDKAVRVLWTTVPAPAMSQVPDAKRWCQQQESTGRFYFHFTNTRWWFEKETDATFFILMWSGKK